MLNMCLYQKTKEIWAGRDCKKKEEEKEYNSILKLYKGDT